MNKESLLSQLNDGRTASVLLSWLEPFFSDTQKEVLEQLKTLFRQGQYTEQILACHVAQLIAIDDLRTRIKGKVNQGDDAAQRLSEEPHDGTTEPELE